MRLFWGGTGVRSSGVALGWLWCGSDVALGWLWCNFGVALGLLWCGSGVTTGQLSADGLHPDASGSVLQYVKIACAWGGVAPKLYTILMCLACAAITANMHSYVPRVRRLCDIGSAILALRCKPLMNAISNAHGQGCECNHKNHTTPRSRSSKGHNGSCFNNARLNYNPMKTNTQFNTTPNQTRPNQTTPDHTNAR